MTVEQKTESPYLPDTAQIPWYSYGKPQFKTVKQLKQLVDPSIGIKKIAASGESVLSVPSIPSVFCEKDEHGVPRVAILVDALSPKQLELFNIGITLGVKWVLAKGGLPSRFVLYPNKLEDSLILDGFGGLGSVSTLNTLTEKILKKIDSSWRMSRNHGLVFLLVILGLAPLGVGIFFLLSAGFFITGLVLTSFASIFLMIVGVTLGLNNYRGTHFLGSEKYIAGKLGVIGLFFGLNALMLWLAPAVLAIPIAYPLLGLIFAATFFIVSVLVLWRDQPIILSDIAANNFINGQPKYDLTSMCIVEEKNEKKEVVAIKVPENRIIHEDAVPELLRYLKQPHNAVQVLKLDINVSHVFQLIKQIMSIVITKDSLHEIYLSVGHPCGPIKVHLKRERDEAWDTGKIAQAFEKDLSGEQVKALRAAIEHSLNAAAEVTFKLPLYRYLKEKAKEDALLKDQSESSPPAAIVVEREPPSPEKDEKRELSSSVDEASLPAKDKKEEEESAANAVNSRAKETPAIIKFFGHKKFEKHLVGNVFQFLKNGEPGVAQTTTQEGASVFEASGGISATGGGVGVSEGSEISVTLA